VAIEDVTSQQKKAYNKVVTHPLQTYEWGEFRSATGITVVRRIITEQNSIVDGFSLTIHPIPKTPWTIGYLPKGSRPTKKVLNELQKIGKQYHCIFIQLEPNIPNSSSEQQSLKKLGLRMSAHPLFTKYTFVLDLTPSEDEIFKKLHGKTRYNIKIAQRHSVTISEKETPEAFETYLQLTAQTTKRQNFYAHTPNYHTTQWDILSHTAAAPYTSLTSHLLLANYNKKTLAAWILFVFKDTLYYPYGASSNEHRETMSSNLIMWEAIKFGKKLGLKKFDMWGALGPDPDPTDSWFGFHRFKQGYRPDHVEFVGSFDLVLNPVLYRVYSVADKIRWLILQLKK
jgi:lipid II:glycine glycyltransferase (peptidoglycan interpeptide bridge formation enzyme)